MRTHDGFYLRFGLGGGSMKTKLSYDNDVADASASGGAVGGHLMLGGTVAKGFVIGAAMGGITVVEPKFEQDGYQGTAENTTLNLSHLGLLLDWFPDEHGGFHVGGSLGIYTMKVEADNGPSSDAAGGGGGQLFVGYDFWVGDDWSLGGLLALTHANTELDAKGFKQTGSTNALMLQFSVLYH